MRKRWWALAGLALFLFHGGAPVRAQGGAQMSLSAPLQPPGPYGSGVVRGTATAGELALSLEEAIQRGEKSNLGALLSEQELRRSDAARTRARSELLPNFGLRTMGSEQQINLAAFGFSNFPGIAPIVGPFGIFDVRAYASERFELRSLRGLRASAEGVKATGFSYQNSRDTVALAVGGLYLQALTGASRVEAARALVATAEAVHRQAQDYKQSGLIPAIDVLRAEVELEAQRQRLITAENDYEKMRLGLAQAIGLPLDQKFRLTDALGDAALPPVPLQVALDKAYENRADYRAVQAAVKAAEFARRAEVARRYPSVGANFDYGTIGQSVVQNHGTFSAVVSLNVPVFEGGRIDAGIVEADSVLKQRTAERDAMRGRIEYEMRSVYMDLKATYEQVALARHAVQLATAQVRQSQDRFANGVTTSLEVVQAEQALAVATDNQLASLFGYNLAKGMLARTAGQAEKLFSVFVLGGK